MTELKKRAKRRLLVGQVRRWMQLEGSDLVKSETAQASDYLYHCKSYLRKYPGTLVILYIRVSTGAQKYKHNLETLETILRSKLKKYKSSIVGCYRDVSSGWILNDDRRILINAAEKARKLMKLGKNVLIITTSADRFLRHVDWTPQNNILPTQKMFKKLAELTFNVPLATLLHPNKQQNGKGVRSYQAKWGQLIKGNKGGRPKKRIPGYKKKRRLEKLEQLKELCLKRKTLAQIAAQMPDIPKPTLWYWRKYFISTI